MLAAILLVAQPSTFARARSQACNATKIFIELMFATGAIRLLRISKFGIGAQELTVFVKATRFAVEHGGLTQGVPDLATLVLFTSFSMGVVWGRAVLEALFWEGSPNSGRWGALSFF
jgi:hypothetical protein